MYLIIFTLFFFQSLCLASQEKFFDEIRLKDVEKVKQLLEEDPKLVHAKDKMFEYGPLHVAIQTNCYEIIKILLERGADIEDKDWVGETPLHFAAKNYNLSDLERIIDLLIEKGADINQKNEEDETPLHFAVHEKKKKGIVSLLLQAGASVNIKDVLGRTPLHLAAMFGSEEIIKLLIEKGADIHQKNENGRTPLHFAVNSEENNERTVLSLIQAGAKIHEKNNAEKTPLDEARKWRYVEIIKILEAHAALEETKKDLTEGMPEKRPSNILS